MCRCSATPTWGRPGDVCEDLRANLLYRMRQIRAKEGGEDETGEEPEDPPEEPVTDPPPEEDDGDDGTFF